MIQWVVQKVGSEIMLYLAALHVSFGKIKLRFVFGNMVDGFFLELEISWSLTGRPANLFQNTP